ncbi:trihelix transcription factor GTL2-like [Punica granatum]|uniref:Uncharacterized protein n=2 Tax=Punica granatum TaxID=22663 RepID=A0A218VRZ1_PUNGR|nr:trihelix transcription factor GTL2-like [Punica granatum]OWM63314.1 hypothetical protein CDL15_Pgr022059 [Punica granatum]PKI70060.1 hypothetical protein CRG98_009523 [Punica granatum]
MHNSRYGLENSNHGREQFMEAHRTPSLFSVPYHHLHHNHHLPRYPQITFRQPMQELPAIFKLDQGEHEEEEEEEEEQLGRCFQGLFGHTGLQSQPGVHHQAPVPSVNVNFELGLSENGSCNPAPCYSISNEAQVLHLPQQDCYSAPKEPSWRSLSIGDLNTDIRMCNEMENMGSALFGELEAVCNLAKGREVSQTCSSTALTAENSPPIMPLTALKDLNAGPARVDSRGSESLKSVSLRKAERRKRKRKLNEELRLTSAFLEALLKQVMDHQDFLHRKFLEVIERMERERIEREQEWRKREVRKNESEAAARAREQALVTSREALIVNYLQKIMDQSPNLPKESNPQLSRRKC